MTRSWNSLCDEFLPPRHPFASLNVFLHPTFASVTQFWGGSLENCCSLFLFGWFSNGLFWYTPTDWWFCFGLKNLQGFVLNYWLMVVWLASKLWFFSYLLRTAIFKLFGLTGFSPFCLRWCHTDLRWFSCGLFFKFFVWMVLRRTALVYFGRLMICFGLKIL